MKIAVLAHSHFPIRDPYAGGLELHTHMVCRELVSLGHRVTLYAQGGSDAVGHELRETLPASFAFHKYPKGSMARLKQKEALSRGYLRALREIEYEGFDAVINNSLSPTPLEWPTSAPQLNLLHTPVLEGMKKAIEKVSSPRNTLFVSVSESNATSWRPFIQDVRVVHNGADIPKVTPGRRSQDLIWSARITAEKGLHEAIRAAHLAGRRLRIAGPISDPEYFENCIRPALNTDVEYVGHLGRHELAEFYASGAATLATPLWAEPFGLVVAESLQCGTPVAAYPRGAMAELIDPTVGVVSERATPASLAAAVPLAEASSPLACQKYGMERFSTSAMVRSYLNLVEELRLRAPLAGDQGDVCTV